METKTAVNPVKIDYECPKCKIGKLRSTGVVPTSAPPQYPHTCNNPECDYKHVFINKSYPYIDYIPVPIVDKLNERIKKLKSDLAYYTKPRGIPVSFSDEAHLYYKQIPIRLLELEYICSLIDE